MIWIFPKKLGIKQAYDPAIPLLDIYPEETKIEKDTCIPLFITALFIIAGTWEQPRWPSRDEWIEQLCTQPQKGTPLSHSNEVDEPRTYYTE